MQLKIGSVAVLAACLLSAGCSPDADNEEAASRQGTPEAPRIDGAETQAAATAGQQAMANQVRGQQADVADIDSPFTRGAPNQENACRPEGSLHYICGPRNAEDLVRLGDSPYLLASGMRRADAVGNLYLVDSRDMTYQGLIFENDIPMSLDASAWPDCPGPLPLGNFSMHGLSVRQNGAERFEVYATSHGEREAVEIFELDISGTSPALAWKGCVPLPNEVYANSVAILPDGGFLVTDTLDPVEGFASISEGEVSGQVLEWHPGDEVRPVEGTALSGPNGLLLSDDGRYMYVTAMGTRELVRFDRSATPPARQSVPLDIVPDNVDWGDEGVLLIAGNNYNEAGTCPGSRCMTGWSVVGMNAENLLPYTLANYNASFELQNVSTAILMDGNYWIGTFDGDRIGWFSR